MRAPNSLLSTSRLVLAPAHEDLAISVIEFYQRNEVHLTPWEPQKPMDFLTEAVQRKRLQKAEADTRAGTAMRWWLYLKGEPNVLVGSIGLNGIARGPFQNALLGYALDGELQGQGLMQEGLSAVIAYAFSAETNLHRIQANVRPDNLRSLRVLERLGFEREGFARDYLYIQDKWHDHMMLALRNADFKGIPTV
jgi:ribosomal-protein-alanine N-acetyltransferase